jgi:hypothetical protein
VPPTVGERLTVARDICWHDVLPRHVWDSGDQTEE